MPIGASSAALMTSTRNQALMAAWSARYAVRISAVGSFRILG